MLNDKFYFTDVIAAASVQLTCVRQPQLLDKCCCQSLVTDADCKHGTATAELFYGIADLFLKLLIGEKV